MISHCQVSSPISGTLSPQLIPPMRVVEIVPIEKASRLAHENNTNESLFLFDLGNNNAGVLRLSLLPGTPAGDPHFLRFLR